MPVVARSAARLRGMFSSTRNWQSAAGALTVRAGTGEQLVCRQPPPPIRMRRAAPRSRSRPALPGDAAQLRVADVAEIRPFQGQRQELMLELGQALALDVLAKELV